MFSVGEVGSSLSSSEVSRQARTSGLHFHLQSKADVEIGVGAGCERMHLEFWKTGVDRQQLH
jgi:hypothetical protein